MFMNLLIFTNFMGFDVSLKSHNTSKSSLEAESTKCNYSLEFYVENSLIQNDKFRGRKDLICVKINGNYDIEFGDRVFFGCKNLERVDIYQNVTFFGKEVFNKTPNLNTILYNGTKKPICLPDTFIGCNITNVFVRIDYPYDDFCGFEVTKTLTNEYLNDSNIYSLSFPDIYSPSLPDIYPSTFQYTYVCTFTHIEKPVENKNYGLIFKIGIPVVCLSVFGLIIIFCYLKWKKRQKKQTTSINEQEL